MRIITGYKVLSSTRELASRLFAAALLVCGCWTGISYAAVLNVDLDVRTSAIENDSLTQRKNVAIFVLDRSGSMVLRAPEDPSQKRNALLKASVTERIQTLSKTAPSTQVYLLPFSGWIERIEGPFSLDSKSEREYVLNWSEKGCDTTKCKGDTVLYDTLAYAIDFADGLINKDHKVKVQIYGYTDGQNCTPRDGMLTNWNINASSQDVKEKIVPVKFPTKNEFDKKARDAAYKSYKEKYGKKIERFIADGNMDDDIQWRWLGDGNPPEGVKNVRVDEYKMFFKPSAYSLKNPASVAEQKLPVTLMIPVPSAQEKDLSKLSATLTLDINGRKVSNLISLAPGKRTVSLQIPDVSGGNRFKGELSIENIPDVWERVSLKSPTPLKIDFSEPDRLSFLSLEPKGDVYAKVGEKVEFSAKASDGATIRWIIDGKDTGKSSVSPSFDKAGEHSAKALAQKTGFADASSVVKVHVIDASVNVKVASQNPTVGKPVNFEAQANGQPENFSWWIDGHSIYEKGKSISNLVFDRSGKHTVKVRAYYGHSISADSSELIFEVAAEPQLTIKTPVPGSEYDFGQKIECTANVEGDFDKVVWTIDGPAPETMEASVAKDQRIAQPAYFKPAKDGAYTLSAKAIGKSGEIEATTKVKFTVAHENFVTIVSPASGTIIDLGPGAKNPELRAQVKDDQIRKIKWTILNTKTDNKSDIRTTPVQDGVATCACPNDETIGNSVKLLVQAEAVYDPPRSGEPIVSPQIELITLLDADIDIEAKIDGGEANGRNVSFGKQVELIANCGGCIDPATVQWFAESDGNERPIGNGPRCMSQKEESKGENLRTVYYFARAKLPDGTIKQSRKISVFYCCGCQDLVVSMKITDQGNNPEKIFSLSDEVKGFLSLSKNDVVLEDIVWDMGDGTIKKDNPVHHTYEDYTNTIITATGKCKYCGKEYKASFAIEVQEKPAEAQFKIEPVKSTYPVNGVVRLIDESKGDVKHRKWYVDDGHGRKEIPGSADAKEIDYRLPKIPDNLTFSLEVIDNSGKMAKPYEVEKRVRLGWWAVLFFLTAFASIIYILKFILLGNEVLNMVIKASLGPLPNGSLNDLCAAIDNANIEDYSIAEELAFKEKIKTIFSKKPKKVYVRVVDLVKDDKNDDKYNRFKETAIPFKVFNKNPDIEYEEIIKERFRDKTPSKWQLSSPYTDKDEAHTRIRILKDRLWNDKKDECLNLVMRLEPSWLWKFIFVLITIILFVLVFYLCVQYAI